MLVIGYCFGIRSERKLCEEVHLNLAYRWFCRLDLEDQIPDHSTFSKNRHGRFRQSDAFRLVFENVLRRCMHEGLVRGEGFAVDASVIKADASRARGVPGAEAVKWRDDAASTRAVREYIEALQAENPATADEPSPPPPPKKVSLTDPAAQWTAAPAGPAFFAYSTNYLIDLAVTDRRNRATDVRRNGARNRWVERASRGVTLGWILKAFAVPVSLLPWRSAWAPGTTARPAPGSRRCGAAGPGSRWPAAGWPGRPDPIR